MSNRRRIDGRSVGRSVSHMRFNMNKLRLDYFVSFFFLFFDKTAIPGIRLTNCDKIKSSGNFLKQLLYFVTLQWMNKRDYSLFNYRWHYFFNFF